MPDGEPSVLERAAAFLWGNARLLERTVFARAFLDGPVEPVMRALRAYENPDRGFGHALEPDLRAPDSMPLHCEIALRSLAQAGVRDPDLALGICDFLDPIAELDGRVPIVLPQVRDYPHSPIWDEPLFMGDSPNPTAALVGLLRQHAARHPWLDRAEAWCWERARSPVDDAHELLVLLTFLDTAPDRARARDLALRQLERLDQLAYYNADPDAQDYGLTPLQLCPRPDAVGHEAFPADLLKAHLDALRAQQHDDGGWPLNFQSVGPGAEAEWRGRWTLDALFILRAYGRLRR